jgi:tetratricopeptide (TPR) repeat protein
LRSDYADAFNNRGTAYQLIGRYQQALADFQDAIRLKPNDPNAYYNRGKVYRDLGRYDDAIADYNTLIFLTPNFPSAYNGRAYANFHANRFQAAVSDFQRSLALDPNQAYPILWLHLAQQRVRHLDVEEFAVNAARIDARVWPSPIAGYFAGKTTAADLAMIAGDADVPVRPAQLCDVDFFLGESALTQHQTAKARKFFDEARRICPIVSPSYTGAVAELRRR